MCPIIPVLAVFVAQAQPSPTRCFERDQGAQLCEQTEDECRKLLDLNTEIARSPCRVVRSKEQQPSIPPPEAQ
jgi:hypothetical protein